MDTVYLTKVFTLKDLDAQIEALEANGIEPTPALLQRAGSWRDFDHPIIINIIANWSKAAVVEIFRKGVRLGKLVKIDLATRSPFYCIVYSNGNWQPTEMVSAGVLHRVEVTKIHPLLYRVNIPE
jgi:hypothetical protein